MTTADSRLAWGDHALAFDQWHQIDDLWIALSEKAMETDISYSYATQHSSRWLRFSELRELRIPLATALNVSQRLSTRPVVARPYTPISLPARQRVQLYVGTPLWLTISQDSDVMLDVPVSRISDTWFGADTLKGEVCFDCRTKARLSMTDIAPNPYKAITPIEIHNDANAPMSIDRMNLPIPHMALFSGPDRHWTSPLVLHCGDSRAGSTEVRVTIRDTPHSECEDAVLIAEPRHPLESGILHKTMDLLLG